MGTNQSSSELSEQVAALSKQVAALQEQIDIVRSCLQFQVQSESTRTPTVHLRCASVRLVYPDAPERTQALLKADSQGASISLLNNREQPLLSLTVKNETPRCAFYGQPSLESIVLTAEPATGRGEIAVAESGKPRAVMKAAELGGAVSVLHDDGRPRALLFGGAEHGEIFALAADSRAAAKLSCEKAHGGGMLTVSGNDAIPATVVAAGPEGGMVMTLRKDGKVGCSMATMAKVSGISVEDLGQGQIHLLSEANGPSLRLTDPEGRPRLSLARTVNGATLSFDSHTEHPHIRLSAQADQVSFDLDNNKGDHITLQTATDGGAVFALSNPANQPQLMIMNSKAGPSIALQPKPDQGAAATLACSKEGGALFICDAEGTRRCGLCATEDGSQLMLFNDLGIERVLLGSAQDGGALRLNWGGTMGVAALATQEGGAVVVNDANGQPRASLPPSEES